MGSKPCCRCKAVLPVSEFYRDRSRSDGLTAQCKTCKRDLLRAYNAAHPEAAPARQARYEAAHPERRAEIHKRWRDKNPDWSAENNRKWRELNPGAAAAYHATNRDKARARWLKRQALKRGATVGPVDLDVLWEANQGTCQLCNHPIDRSLRGPDPMSPSVDHIVPLSKGGTHEQSNVQWTHLVCNKKKGARMPAHHPIALIEGA